MWKRNNHHKTRNHQKKSSYENWSVRQRWHYFILNVSAFAAVFLALGVITIQILHATTYSETDISLRNLAANTHMISDAIKRSTDDFVPSQSEMIIISFVVSYKSLRLSKTTLLAKFTCLLIISQTLLFL